MKPDYIDIHSSIRKLYSSKNIPNSAKEAFIKEMKATGELDQYFEKEDITEKIEVLLRSFVEALESPKSKPYKYFKKFCLSNFQFFGRLYSNFNYELGAFLTEGTEITEADEKLFKSFPHVFKRACEKFNIEPYASMDPEELHLFLSDYVDMAGYRLVMPEPSSCNRSDVTEQLIEHVFNNIKGSKKYNATKFGNGYGYCIIHRDKKHGKEFLITVKAASRDDFYINRVEYKVMRDAASLPNTEYFVVKYDCSYTNSSARVNSHQVYRYDIERNVLVDVKDPSNIRRLDAEFEYKREGRIVEVPRVRFKCKKLVLTPTDNNDNNK